MRALVDEHHRTEQVWMAGMKIPIDVAWIAAGRVLSVQTLQPCADAPQDECPRWTSPEAVDALPEVPAGALDTVTTGERVIVTTASPRSSARARQ